MVETGKELVQCRRCGLSYRRITASHLATHHMSLLDYELRYPDAPIMSEGDRSNQAAVMSKVSLECWSDPSYYSRRVDSMGQTMGEYWTRPENSKRQSERMTKRLEEMWKDPLYSEGYFIRQWTGEERDLQSERMSKNWRIPEFRFMMLEILSKLRKPLSEDHKETIRQTKKKQWEDPDFVREQLEARKLSPNDEETDCLIKLNKFFPNEWEFTGSKSRADFTHKTLPKVINYNGSYWHDEEEFPNRPTDAEIVEFFKEWGLDCLVLTPLDVYGDEGIFGGKVRGFLNGR